MTDRPTTDRPTVGPWVDGLLGAVWQAGGTDLLLTVGMPPKMRVHGALHPVPSQQPLSERDTQTLLGELLTAEQAASVDPRREYDFSVSWRDLARVRGNAFSQRGHTAVALRIIPRRVPTLAELGVPLIVRSFPAMHQGLVLVTGPTGSGKSTTLAAMIDQVNPERACHII